MLCWFSHHPINGMLVSTFRHQNYSTTTTCLWYSENVNLITYKDKKHYDSGTYAPICQQRACWHCWPYGKHFRYSTKSTLQTTVAFLNRALNIWLKFKRHQTLNILFLMCTVCKVQSYKCMIQIFLYWICFDYYCYDVFPAESCTVCQDVWKNVWSSRLTSCFLYHSHTLSETLIRNLGLRFVANWALIINHWTLIGVHVSFKHKVHKTTGRTGL